MMMSHCVQPSAAISAREVGRKVAGTEPATLPLFSENKGVALCTPAIRPEPAFKYNESQSSDIDGEIDLGVFALHQQCEVMSRAGDLALQVGDRGNPNPVDTQHHVPGLQSGGQCGSADIFDQQSALGVQFLLLTGLKRSQHEPELAAAILAGAMRDLGRSVLQQYRLHRHLGGLAIVPD